MIDSISTHLHDLGIDEVSSYAHILGVVLKHLSHKYRFSVLVVNNVHEHMVHGTVPKFGLNWTNQVN
ncbi:MAG: hypothetical protein V2I33_18820, partial [Kangiellaceae bacterium]|nr:hypothetical protein [Kangiellaceae bacterium]